MDLLIAAVAAAVGVLLAAFFLRRKFLRLEKYAASTETEHRRVMDSLMAAQEQMDRKVLLQIADWGPDFTGEDDVLGRFRWVASSIDLLLGQPNILMVGNERTYTEAVLSAYVWLEEQTNPVAVVTMLGVDDAEEVPGGQPSHS